MPYPAQVNRETIIEKARELVEAQGVDQLSLGALARELGIKAPSLYHHFQNKTALLRAVNEATGAALVAALQDAIDAASDIHDQIAAMFHAYRAFAHAHPAAYGLVFTNTIAELRGDPQQAEQLALPLQALMARLVGETDSLAALRGAWALMHGFVMLELAGQFRRGGDLDEAFWKVVEAYVQGWEK
jgi:AcrR family transcriptional regulator